MPDTFTANFNLTKPEVNGSRDTWGGKDNANLDTIDGILKNLTDNKLNKAGAKTVDGTTNFTTLPTSGAAGAEKAIATQEWVTAAIAAAVLALLPPGSIIAWKGAAIPAGWALCNGLNGTPDMRDKFLVGAGLTYGLLVLGGSATHDHNAATGQTAITTLQMPSHAHGVHDDGHTHGLSQSGHSHTYTAPNGTQGVAPGAVSVPSSSINTSTQAAAISISVQTAAAGIIVQANGGGQGHSHGITADNHLPPFRALYYIMRL